MAFDGNMALDISTDPGCSRAMNPDMVQAAAWAKIAEASHISLFFTAIASLHSAQNHSASLPLLSLHHILMVMVPTCPHLRAVGGPLPQLILDTGVW